MNDKHMRELSIAELDVVNGAGGWGSLSKAVVGAGGTLALTAEGAEFGAEVGLAGGPVGIAVGAAVGGLIGFGTGLLVWHSWANK